MIQPHIEQLLAKTPCLPVVVIDNAADAVPMARALLAGGIANVEITLRTAAALDAIRTIQANVPEMTVGAGTVFTADQVAAAKAAGCRYIVSPGLSHAVHTACLAQQIDYLPGTVTASEIQNARELGYRFLKFFPAEAYGGIKTLKALAPVFQDIRFCATGGITADNAASYLALPNIIGVGMSSIVPKEAFAKKDWALVTKLATEIRAAVA